MKPSNSRWHWPSIALVAGLFAFAGCVPIETVRTVRPTLDEVRMGNVRGPGVEDTALRPGEIAADVAEINRSRQEVYVITDNGQRQVVPFDYKLTRVLYHGREYTVDYLEAGDRIAYLPAPRGRGYIDIVRIQEPVQARTSPRFAQSNPPLRPRTDIVEGTVDRVDANLGVFDVTPRTGRRITVSVPYNARQSDVDSFRTLRRGDLVRIEGEFVSPENLQLLAFLSPRDR